MTIVNCTPHAITIVVDGKTTTFPPSGIIPRVETSESQADSIGGCACVRQEKGEVIGLPPEDNEGCRNCDNWNGGEALCRACCPPQTFFIVSGMVFSASERPDLIAPDTGKTAVRDEKGQIMAVTRFIRK